MEFRLYRDTKGEWRWRLVAENNKIIATSGEGYHNKADCLDAISMVQRTTLKVAIIDVTTGEIV